MCPFTSMNIDGVQLLKDRKEALDSISYAVAGLSQGGFTIPRHTANIQLEKIRDAVDLLEKIGYVQSLIINNKTCPECGTALEITNYNFNSDATHYYCPKCKAGSQ